MIKVVILTSSYNGTAAYHLPFLIESGVCQVSLVVVSQKTRMRSIQAIKRSVRKIIRIGLLGALNGIRMRRWYGKETRKYIRIGNIEDICNKNDIPFSTTPSINCETTINLFQKSKADLGISLGNGYIASRGFSIPKYGMINLHHEILPHYQNAQSIIWQLYNLSSKTGYTFHRINAQIDKGDIIFQEYVSINFSHSLSDTVAKTSSLLLTESAKGLVYVLQNFHNLIKNATPQGVGGHYTTPSFLQYLRIEKNFRKLRDKEFTNSTK